MEKENRHNSSAPLDPAEERRLRLEEYKRAKQAKKEAEGRSMFAKRAAETGAKTAGKGTVKHKKVQELSVMSTEEVGMKSSHGNQTEELQLACPISRSEFKVPEEKGVPNAEPDFPTQLAEPKMAEPAIQAVPLAIRSCEDEQDIATEKGNPKLNGLAREIIAPAEGGYPKNCPKDINNGRKRTILDMTKPVFLFSPRSGRYKRLIKKRNVTIEQRVVKLVSRIAENWNNRTFGQVVTTPPTFSGRKSDASGISTPEIHALLSPCRTPDIDAMEEETLRLQCQVDEVVRRTPVLQRTTPPRHAGLIVRAATAIRDAQSKIIEGGSSRPSTPGKKVPDELDRGSSYLFALVTPGKRLRDLLETKQAVSPVRRSTRLLGRAIGTGKQALYKDLDQIQDLAEFGFIPNNAIRHGTPTKSKPDPENRSTIKKNKQGSEAEGTSQPNQFQ